VRGRESPSEAASVDLISLSLPLRLSRRVSKMLLVSLIPPSLEDLDPREPTILDRHSPSRRSTMSPSTLFEGRSRRETRPSSKPPRFRDLSLRRDSEERSSTRETRLRDGRPAKKPPLPMRSCFPSILRRKRHLTRLLVPLSRLRRLRPRRLCLLLQPRSES
jgi:hypothetical protein